MTTAHASPLRGRALVLRIEPPASRPFRAPIADAFASKALRAVLA